MKNKNACVFYGICYVLKCNLNVKFEILNVVDSVFRFYQPQIWYKKDHQWHHTTFTYGMMVSKEAMDEN